MDRVPDRGRRAMLLMGLAGAAAVAAGVVHFRPVPVAPAPRPAPWPSGQSWHLFSASFGDAQRGTVSLNGGGRFETFLTSDAGRTWRPFSTEPGLPTFLDRDHVVTVDLAGGARFGISDDGGGTWQTVPQPVPLAGTAITIQPGGLLGGPFFLGAADGWWFGTSPVRGGPALWRTIDGGRTWIDLGPAGVPAAGPGMLRPVFVDRQRGALAVTATGPAVWPSLLVTRDGGRTWGPVSLAWPPAGAPAGQGAIVVPALLAHGDRLVLSLDLAVDRSSGPGQQLRHQVTASEDGGLTWAPWTAAPATSIAGSTMALDDAGRLLLPDGRRLWSSGDLGRTWQSQSVSGPGGQVAAVVSARGGALFVVSLSGPTGAETLTLLRSLDGGRRWTDVPLPATPPR